MEETEFEGTLVLEKLAAIGRVDEFFEAIDSDNIVEAVALMRAADIDRATIATVVEKIEAADGEH